MSLLAADIGNSHTFLGLLDGEEVTAHWRVNTDERRTADEWSVLLRGLLEHRERRIHDLALLHVDFHAHAKLLRPVQDHRQV